MNYTQASKAWDQLTDFLYEHELLKTSYIAAVAAIGNTLGRGAINERPKKVQSD